MIVVGVGVDLDKKKKGKYFINYFYSIYIVNIYKYTEKGERLLYGAAYLIIDFFFFAF